MIRSILPKLRLLWLWLRLKRSISYPYKFIIRRTQLLCQRILDRCLIAILLRPRRQQLRCVLSQQLRRLSGLLIFRWHLILFALRLFRQFRKSFFELLILVWSYRRRLSHNLMRFSQRLKLRFKLISWTHQGLFSWISGHRRIIWMKILWWLISQLIQHQNVQQELP